MKESCKKMYFIPSPSRIEKLQSLLAKQLKEWKRFTQTKRSYLPKQRSNESSLRRPGNKAGTDKITVPKQSSTSGSGSGYGSGSATGSTECTTLSAARGTDGEGPGRPGQAGQEAADDDPAEWADIRMQNLVADQKTKGSDTFPTSFIESPTDKKRPFFFKKVCISLIFEICMNCRKPFS